jgi:hypothetical protein
MAITKSLTFASVSINGVSYSPFLDESVEVTVEPIAEMVNNGQTLPSAYNVSFSVTVYNTNVDSDTNVYTNTATDPKLISMAFTGGTGGQTLTMSNVIVHGSQTFENGRAGYVLAGSQRVTNLDLGVVLS